MKSLLNTGGLILAAGFSSRMGQFKPLMDLPGGNVIQYTVSAMRRAGIEKIAVVTGHNSDLLTPQLKKLEVVQIFNPDFAKEMFTSMRVGIDYFASSEPQLEGVFMVPVDCPCVRQEDYISLYSAVEGSDRCACCSFMGRKGHPLWIPSHLFRRVLEHNGDGGMKGALAGVEIERIDSENEGVLLDMDTMQGYKDILDFIASGWHFSTAQQVTAGKRLLLVRHGRIVQHEGKIFLGQYDAPLSELGKNDAKAAAEEILRIAPQTDTVYTSPLSRTEQTATAIAKELDLKILKCDNLKEISLGSWDGRLIDDIAAAFPEQYKRRWQEPLTFAPPGGESMIHVRLRVLYALRQICLNDRRRDIILVTHSGIINTVKCLLGQGDFNGVLSMDKAPYGSVTVLEV